ncbi:UvrD-helicase domain-containing protein [Lactococcus lactis]|uniref:UvrD-helicase domain-containing protein n=1 Tax=Lactococcus lactis TaxID=1358 RepID=UPI003D1390D5
MNKIINETNWNPKGDIILEAAAEKAVKINKNVLVVAGPGAGKTELLAQKTDFLFKTNLSEPPRRILAISFKKDAAENLKDRIVKRYGNEYASRFTSLTFDSFAKRILDQFKSALPKNLIPSKDYLVEDRDRIEQVLSKYVYGFESWYKKQKSQEIEKQLYGEQNQKIWRDLLIGDESGNACLTFKMISILARKIIQENPLIRQALQATYSHVFLDEFQDTTTMQYELVKSCFLDGDSIMTAVGDNKQRIMEWAGARKTIFSDFQQDFVAEKISLITNHRSAPRLVELQKMMYESLGEYELEASSSTKWNSNDGEVTLFLSENEIDEGQKIANEIVQKVLLGIAPNEICILVKQLPENYTGQLIPLLKDKGIRARIENEYQDVLKQAIVILLLSIFKVSLKKQTPQEWNYLEEFYFEVVELGEFQNEKNFDFVQDCIKDITKYCSEKMCSITEENDFRVLVVGLINKINRNTIFKIYPEYKQGIYMDSILDQFIELFWKEYVIEEDFNTAIRTFQGENIIPIMTIHKSKGLEYESVYFIGLEDSAFWNFRNKPDADRSAFFVAISRAKKYLSFSYCSNRETMKNYYNPSGDQKRENINEFYDLLSQPGISKIIQ